MTALAKQPTARQATLVCRARALAVVLAEEFDGPFRFHDAQGEQVLIGDASPVPTGPALAPEVVRTLARAGQSEANYLGNGLYQIVLPFHEGHEVGLVAVGVLPALAGTDQPREQRRLQKWVRAVADRFGPGEPPAKQRHSDEEQAAQLNRAWSVVLGLNDAIRHVRLQRDTDRSRMMILKAVQALLGAQTVVWAHDRGFPAPLVQGEPLLSANEAAHLAELITRAHPGPPGEPVVCNEDRASLWAGRLGAIANLLAAPILGGAGGGWVIALNKLPVGSNQPLGPGKMPAVVPFRRSDGAALLPFVALLELQARTSARFVELKELLVGLTRSLTAAIDAKDSHTYGHSERVARIAVELACEMGQPEDRQSDIYLAGLLHDIGKIGIRDAVLQKKGPLTKEEYDHIKQHVTIGYHILANLRSLDNLLPGVLLHHERYDGKGYPQGLAGEEIPLLARILAVADGYDAMSTRRPYREALTCLEVEAILRQGAGSQWDPGVVEAFERCRHRIHLIRQRGVGESLNHALEAALRAGDSTASGPGPRADFEAW